jgi:hypothetical protein
MSRIIRFFLRLHSAMVCKMLSEIYRYYDSHSIIWTHETCILHLSLIIKTKYFSRCFLKHDFEFLEDLECIRFVLEENTQHFKKKSSIKAMKYFLPLNSLRWSVHKCRYRSTRKVSLPYTLTFWIIFSSVSLSHILHNFFSNSKFDNPSLTASWQDLWGLYIPNVRTSCAVTNLLLAY